MTDEAALKLFERIVTGPGKIGGKPIIRGRRVTPAMVLNMLASGATHRDVIDAYSVLEDAAIADHRVIITQISAPSHFRPAYGPIT